MLLITSKGYPSTSRVNSRSTRISAKLIVPDSDVVTLLLEEFSILDAGLLEGYNFQGLTTFGKIAETCILATIHQVKMFLNYGENEKNISNKIRYACRFKVNQNEYQFILEEASSPRSLWTVAVS